MENNYATIPITPFTSRGFQKGQKIEALDTICGVWRPARIDSIANDSVIIKFNFRKMSIMTEPIKNPHDISTWPIRDVAPCVDNCDDNLGHHAYPKRRRMTPSGKPVSYADTVLQATGQYGHTDYQLGYTPSTIITQDTVSLRHISFYLYSTYNSLKISAALIDLLDIYERWFATEKCVFWLWLANDCVAAQKDCTLVLFDIGKRSFFTDKCATWFWWIKKWCTWKLMWN